MRDKHTPESPNMATIIGVWMALACFLLVICMLCAGCSTVAGLGQDLQDGSEMVKEYMGKQQASPSYPQR